MGPLTVLPISLTKDTIAKVVIFYKPTTKAGLPLSLCTQADFAFSVAVLRMDGGGREDSVWRCPSFSHTQTFSSCLRLARLACTKHRYCNWFQLIAEYHWPPPSRSRSLQARVIWVTRCGSVNQLADSNDSGSRQPSTLPAANLQHVQQSPFFSSLPYSSSICRAVCPCVCTRGESGQFQTLFPSEQGYIRSQFFSLPLQLWRNQSTPKFNDNGCFSIDTNQCSS